jgi:hypothetical protein
MADELGLVQRWQHGSLLPRPPVFGGLLLVFAGVWLVIAGPPFHRLWRGIHGAILLVLGSCVFRIGIKGPHHTGSWMPHGCIPGPAFQDTPSTSQTCAKTSRTVRSSWVTPCIGGTGYFAAASASSLVSKTRTDVPMPSIGSSQ